MKRMEEKLNVILDLDNTLVCAVDKSHMTSPDRFKAFDENLKYRDAEFLYVNDDGTSSVLPPEKYRIYARPHLDEFLDYLFENFNVSVFTNAEKDYAMYIVNNFIKGSFESEEKNIENKKRRLDFIFYRYHTFRGNQRFGGIKNLRLIWETYKMYYFFPANTVIIDDLYDVYKTNPLNTIPIKHWNVTPVAINEVLEDDSLVKVGRELFYLDKYYEKDVYSNMTDIESMGTPLLDGYVFKEKTPL